MTVSHLRSRRFAAMAIVVIAVILGACSDDSTPTPESTTALGTSNTPTSAPTGMATAAPTITRIPTPRPTPTPTPTPSPTPEPTETPTPRPTPSPTATLPPATPNPTATPTHLSAIDVVRQSTAWKTLRSVRDLEWELPELTTAVLSLPWVMDGITEVETEDVQELVWAGLHDPDVLRFAVQTSWVVDGLSDDERDVVASLWMVAFEDKAVGRWLIGLPFIKDVTPENAEGAANLARLGFLGRTFAETAFKTWWIADGLDHRETQMADSLLLIAGRDQETALRILDMPFLTTVETSDMLAMHSLARTRDLLQLMSHPSLSEGITDTWAKRIILLYAHSNARHILLDPTIDLLTERHVTLPLTGEATIALFSRSSSSEQILDIMESAVRHHESFMRSPFPTDYIILVREGPEFGVGGYFKGTHAFLQLEQHVNVYAISHELAHYYWGYGGSFWVNEGASDILAFSNLQIGDLNEPCPEFSTIVDLERASSGSAAPIYCSYSLGMRLFADLESSLGEDIFRQGFRNLYLAQRDAGYWGVDQVVAAFEEVDNVPEGSVGRVFGRWYYGTHP